MSQCGCEVSRDGPMSDALLRDIADYCRSIGIAESTFGRLAVNDGKLVGRLRLGGRVTTDTAERVRAFIAREPPPTINGTPTAALPRVPSPTLPTAHNFRFYDNRQKYLLFVTTCSEKQVVTQRVGMELANIHPPPPALRVFDAGMGDGTVLARTMRAMHTRFPDDAVLHRRQGVERRGRAARARKDARPAVRASRHGPGDHQHVLLRGALAEAKLGDLGHQPRLARALAARQHGDR